MSLKLSKTAIRELKKLYCAVLIAAVAGIALVSTSAVADVITTDVTYAGDYDNGTKNISSGAVSKTGYEYSYEYVDNTGALQSASDVALDTAVDKDDFYYQNNVGAYVSTADDFPEQSTYTGATKAGTTGYEVVSTTQSIVSGETVDATKYSYTTGDGQTAALTAETGNVAKDMIQTVTLNDKDSTQITVTNGTASASVDITNYTLEGTNFSVAEIADPLDPTKKDKVKDENGLVFEVPASGTTRDKFDVAVSKINDDETAVSNAQTTTGNNYATEQVNLAKAEQVVADDKVAITTLDGYYSSVGFASGQYDTAVQNKQDQQDAYDVANAPYTAASTLYNTPIETSIKNGADAAIAESVQEGGAIYNAVSSGISDLITDKETKLSADIGYNLADPDNASTGLVARLDALTEESSDKTLVGAINTNTTAIADEITRATGVEANLATAIADETTRATNAENAINANLATEDGAYVASANTVGQNINALDAALASGDNGTYRKSVAYTDARFNQLDHKIDRLEDKMEKGLAANAALAGLTPLSSEHKTQLSAAMGGYGSNQAVAVGAYHYVTDSTLLNAGAAYGGNSDVSYKVGITFGF